MYLINIPINLLKNYQKRKNKEDVRNMKLKKNRIFSRFYSSQRHMDLRGIYMVMGNNLKNQIRKQEWNLEIVRINPFM